MILLLQVWALIWLAAALLGLWWTRETWWRGFYFMSGLWAWVDAGIAWYGQVARLMRGPLPTAELAFILWINAALDVGYLLIAMLLLRRGEPLNRGFGLAIAVQGLFLLIFDVYHAWLLSVGT